MPRTGVYFLPLGATATSPTSKLVAHLSRQYPEQEHHSYHIEHRLFVDTSSQLPNADLVQRAYTQVLTTSRARNAFIGSTKAGDVNDLALVVIPAATVEGFTGLLSTKLQALWYARQALIVDNGMAMRARRNWTISIGDAKVAPKMQGAGTLRGMVVELHDDEDDTGNIEYTDQSRADDREYFAAVLNELFKQTDEIFDSARMNVERTQSRALKSEDPDWGLARAYMITLRGMR